MALNCAYLVTSNRERFLTVQLALAAKNSTEATDESGLVSAAGFVVKLVETGHDNIKLTYPEDVFIAEAILSKRNYIKENLNLGENK